MIALTCRDSWGFWGRWTLATVVGWIAGFFLAIILSYLVVNPFYPKETNLIVGLCLGASVSYAQRYAIRRWIRLQLLFVWGAAIGIGIPFVSFVLLAEWSHEPGASTSIALLALGGLVCGLLQAWALRGVIGRPQLWALSVFALWTAAWIISRIPSTWAVLGATVLHGAGSGGVIIWLLNQARHRSVDRLSRQA